MSKAEWEMVIYAGVAIGILGLGVRFFGFDRLHRLFFCVFFPVSIQLILFAVAYTLASDTAWWGLGVIVLALAVVSITVIKTVDLALKQSESDTLSLAISNMLRAAFIPLVVTLLALITH